MTEGCAARARVVACARAWLGTPYVHGASCRGGGADCLGLIRGVWRELLGPERWSLPQYGPHWAESGDGDRLWQALTRHLVPLTQGDAAPGDVLLFRIGQRGAAKHLGIGTALSQGGIGFVHSYACHGVVESSLTAPWKRRLAARFAFPPR